MMECMNLIFTKNTAFNKNFGTGSGQVAEGNHTHNIYPAKAVAETITHLGCLKRSTQPCSLLWE